MLSDAVRVPSQPIVCGIDFSPSSDHALLWAAAIATRLSRPLQLVTAIEPLLTEAARLQQQSDAFLQQVQRDLEAQGARVSVPGAITTYVESGEPAPVLLEAAGAADAALIVIGARGLGQAARFFLGSTAMRVLRSADRPVLAVPEPDAAAAPARPSTDVTHLVCGVDFSDGALAAARAATDWSRLLGARLTLVHVLAPATMPPVWEALLRQADEERTREATARLEELTQTLGGEADIVVKTGTAVDVLEDLAEDHEGTLIVVGLRGAGYHRPGSTALRLLSASSIPVLAIPDDAQP
jgi:nucleotide-binding universal stress UspA family protein